MIEAPSSTEFNDFTEYDEVVSEVVYDYDIRRSLIKNSLFSLFAVNYMNQVLYPVVVDVSFESAVAYKDAYCSELVKNKG